uniref:PDZ domain-containing protein n=1 Tax=Ciona savignyi TaxID=51511 RepID=H2YU37_CIOSA
MQLLVRHDPPPPEMIDIVLTRGPGEKLGISIRGGVKGHAGNPLDETDEGIFISKINPDGAAYRDGRIKVGQRILEVNGQSLLGCSHSEAVRTLRAIGDHANFLLCKGYNPDEVTVCGLQAEHPALSDISPGVIANTLIQRADSSFLCGRRTHVRGKADSPTRNQYAAGATGVGEGGVGKRGEKEKGAIEENKRC